MFGSEFCWLMREEDGVLGGFWRLMISEAEIRITKEIPSKVVRNLVFIGIILEES